MSNRDDLPEAEILYDRLEIAELLIKAVSSAGGLVRGTKTQEIERHDAPPAGDQIGNQVVVDFQIVGEAVHEHEGWAGACIVSSVDYSLTPRNMVLGELDGIRRHVSSYFPHTEALKLSCDWP